MKTKARRDELLRAMVAVQPACGKNPQITECVKIEVTENNIKLTCTDQELVISAEVDCEPGGETGAILVNAALVGIWHIASCTYNHVSIEWVDEEAGK